MSIISRVFDHFSQVGKPCPICKTRADAPTILVAIPGTESGGNVEAMQVHHECWLLAERMASQERAR